MALRDVGVDAEERLAELVYDAGAAQLRERIVGRPRRDDRAVGQRLARPVVVRDDHLEPAGARFRHLFDGGDAAVDGEDEAAPFVREARERLGAHAVALVEAARQVPVDVGAQLAQKMDGEGGGGDAVDVVIAMHADASPAGDRGADSLAGERHVAEQEGVVRRPLPGQECPRGGGVVVAAPDENACRELAHPESGGEPGLHLVRARTQCPGALVHRVVTVRGAPDGIRLAP